jgi:cyclophilin family peptidyl-prolyl cis-trans isomerase
LCSFNTTSERDFEELVATGTGKGGESIYGKHFSDEIVESLKFSARGIVGMANKGPDTNGSQFFIAYQKLPHLNMKYPIFAKYVPFCPTPAKKSNCHATLSS